MLMLAHKVFFLPFFRLNICIRNRQRNNKETGKKIQQAFRWMTKLKLGSFIDCTCANATCFAMQTQPYGMGEKKLHLQIYNGN